MKQETNSLGDIVQKYSIESTPLMKEERSIVETIVTNENFETVVKAYEDNVHESEMINDTEIQEQQSDFQSENEGDQENENQKEKPQNDE